MIWGRVANIGDVVQNMLPKKMAKKSDNGRTQPENQSRGMVKKNCGGRVIVSGLECLGGGSKKNIFVEWSKSARKSIMILAFKGFALKCFLKNVSF